MRLLAVDRGDAAPFPDLRLDGESDRLASTFLNQYRSIPVALGG